tara:strand:- start:806 stop:1981 length:1176 start_codon:yes stop_codon:yes gene_type:complete
VALTKVQTALTNSGIVNVLDYGAVGDGVTDDTVALNAAKTANGTAGTIHVPAGSYLYSGVVYPVGTDAFWTNSGFSTGVNMMSSVRSTGVFITTETTPAGISAPKDGVYSRAGIGITASIRGAQHGNGIRSNLINYSTDGNGNTAVYAAAHSIDTNVLWSAALHGETRHGGGTSLGVVTESSSYETTGSLLGAVFHNTTAITKTHPNTGATGVDCTVAKAILITGGNTTGTAAGGWVNGIEINANSMRAGGRSIYVHPRATVVSHFETGTGSPATTADILLAGNSTVGIALNGEYTSSAIRVKGGQKYAFEATSAITMAYNAPVVAFASSGTERVGLSVSSDAALQGLRVVGTRVVGPQGDAVADATDLSTAISRLNDLLSRLRAHGLIDT